MLVSSATDGTVRFWEIDTGKQVSMVRVPGYNIQGLQFSPDGTYIAAAGSEEEGDPWSATGVLVLWNLETGAQEILQEYDSWVVDVLFNRSGSLLAYYTADASVHLMDMVTKQEIAFLQGEKDYGPAIVGMAFSDNRLILVPGNDYGSSFQTWNWETGEHIVLASLPETAGYGPAFHPTERLIAVIQRGEHNWDEVHILNWATEGQEIEKPLRVLKARGATLGQVAFSPDGRFLAADALHNIRVYGIK